MKAASTAYREKKPVTITPIVKITKDRIISFPVFSSADVFRFHVACPFLPDCSA
jgi:hypothetical protein